MLSLVDGKAGAKIITLLIKDACKKKRQDGYHDEYYYTVLHRLKKDGLVANPKRGIWMITSKGRDHARNMQTQRVPKPAVSREDADVAVIFDIPEINRKKRAAVRYELFMRGFFAFQKSVWLGKGPLDIDFISFLKVTRLLRYVHIFTIAKHGTI
jgi:DNA-binding transcriptional regulator PaaX